MAARIHIGTEVFDLPEQPPLVDLAQSLLDAYQSGTAIQIQVLTPTGDTLLLILDPKQLPYIAIDTAGSWLGFHS